MVEVASEAVDSTAQETNPEDQNSEEEKVEETQSPTCDETFNDPVTPETKFTNDWTLWEHYESHTGEKMDYASSYCKACWFNDLISFAVAWQTIPHRDLKNIFYNHESATVKV